GGLAPWHLEGGCDLVFQIGTAKYGVRHPDGSLSAARLKEVAAHDTVRMFEIKLSQGAKPGKGGILPAAKVTEEIARIRGIPIHQDSLSPNRHPEIRGNAELLEMIARVREITGKPVGFKVVLGGQGWLDELFAEIVRRGSEWAPDFITVDGAEGGSGAAPQPLMDAMGLPLREALPLLVDKLVQYGLRERVRVVASGRLITPIGVAWALCMGADFVASARGPMFALGCIQAMRCHRNTCPTGITTHDPRFQQGLDPELKSLWVANYLRRVAHEVGMIAPSCGVREPRELRRRHCRVVTGDGRSRSLEELFPQPHSG
ncbi:MAG TPA: FMN-binding glutamate synthase family protein, partial [Chromatiales bacterium]|nr:FMN-binding glutamate synthase family protein [Chromatiales bacterium]